MSQCTDTSRQQVTSKWGKGIPFFQYSKCPLYSGSKCLTEVARDQQVRTGTPPTGWMTQVIITRCMHAAASRLFRVWLLKYTRAWSLKPLVSIPVSSIGTGTCNSFVETTRWVVHITFRIQLAVSSPINLWLSATYRARREKVGSVSPAFNRVWLHGSWD